MSYIVHLPLIFLYPSHSYPKRRDDRCPQVLSPPLSKSCVIILDLSFFLFVFRSSTLLSLCQSPLQFLCQGRGRLSPIVVPCAGLSQLSSFLNLLWFCLSHNLPLPQKDLSPSSAEKHAHNKFPLLSLYWIPALTTSLKIDRFGILHYTHRTSILTESRTKVVKASLPCPPVLTQKHPSPLHSRDNLMSSHLGRELGQ